MIRPTQRAALLFALTIPVALLLVTGFRDWWYAALYLPGFVLAMTGVDLTMVLPNSRLLVEFETPARLYIGEQGLVKLRLTAEEHERPVPVTALLEFTGDADDPRSIEGVIRQAPLELTLTINPLRRGRLVLEALWLRWRGPLGLIEVRRRQPLGETVEIMPDVHGIHDAALQFFSHDSIYGVKSQRARGEGTEYDKLSEFSQGMDNRFIDWKHSARHRKLLCKEFRQERNHQIVLGFDTGHLMLEPIEGMSKLDHAIKAGLLLSWVSLYSGDLVGGCGFDVNLSSFIKPGRGMPYFIQVQRFTSRLDYHAEETNYTLGLAELNSRLQRRAMVVLFTEFVDTVSAELLVESLQYIVKRHVVVFVTLRDPMLSGLVGAAPNDFGSMARSVIADDFLRERAVVLEKIARLGVHCLDAPANGVSAALLNRYLLIKQRGLL